MASVAAGAAGGAAAAAAAAGGAASAAGASALGMVTSVQRFAVTAGVSANLSDLYRGVACGLQWSNFQVGGSRQCGVVVCGVKHGTVWCLGSQDSKGRPVVAPCLNCCH